MGLTRVRAELLLKYDDRHRLGRVAVRAWSYRYLLAQFRYGSIELWKPEHVSNLTPHGKFEANCEERPLLLWERH